MKRFILVTLLLLISLSSFALIQGMSCTASGQAFYSTVDPNTGNIVNWSPAGGCAGGPWVVLFLIAPNGGPDGCSHFPCSNTISQEIHNNWNIQSGYDCPVTLSPEQLQQLLDGSAPKVVLNPYILGDAITQYMLNVSSK